MKPPTLFHPSITRFWCGCRIEEKLVLIVAALVIPFCVGFEYSMQHNRASLPPIFVAAPNEKSVVAKPPSKFIFIHVAGKVRRPGLLKLPQGARVFQAISAAGGATDQKAVQKLNLAETLRDGQKIVVGEKLAVPLKDVADSTSSTRLPLREATTSRRTARKPLPATAINVNTASLAELEQLPGVGPTLAARIVAARKQKTFLNSADLDAVSGIGSKKLEAMKPFIAF